MEENNVEEIIFDTFNEANEFVTLVESKKFYGNCSITQLPIAINSLFATELFLKVILLKNGHTVKYVEKKGHDLKKLFNALPDELKNNINNFMLAFKRKDIFELTDNIKNAFTDLRYMYLEDEIREFNLDLILEFMYKMQYEASMSIKGNDVYAENEKKTEKQKEEEYNILSHRYAIKEAITRVKNEIIIQKKSHNEILNYEDLIKMKLDLSNNCIFSDEEWKFIVKQALNKSNKEIIKVKDYIYDIEVDEELNDFYNCFRSIHNSFRQDLSDEINQKCYSLIQTLLKELRKNYPINNDIANNQMIDRITFVNDD